MNSSGLVDAVLTSDSDIFMFGAHHVLQAYVSSAFLTSELITTYTYLQDFNCPKSHIE